MREVMEMSEKRMGKMSLGSFSGIKKQPAKANKPAEPDTVIEAEATSEPQPEPTSKPKAESKTKTKTKKTTAQPKTTTKAKAKVSNKTQAKKELVTVNIKIRKDQKTWLTDTASNIRNNNSEPVPPSERVYPQHLIGIAIDFLEAAEVNWDEVRNVEELREQLNL